MRDMTKKDFWLNAQVAVIGGGSWGTVLANLASQNTRDVRLWLRSEDQARAINATRVNAEYVPELKLDAKVHAMSSMDRAFEGGVQLVIWALPSTVCRQKAKEVAHFFRGDEVVLHATKGIEQASLKRVSEILREELPVARIGVISGPNLAREIAKGEPAATVVASRFEEVVRAGQEILSSETFRVYGADDVIGVEWAGVMKNVLAIASGALDGMGLGLNARALLISRGLAEMVRFGVRMGGQEATFLGLAGVGDVLATASSALSRNYRVGKRLAEGATLAQVEQELESTAEGVETARTLHRAARELGIEMPITAAVEGLLEGRVAVKDVLSGLMTRPVGG